MDYYEVEFNSGRGESIDFLKIQETPENVASLLKKYLRDMPDKPLFTKDLQDEVSKSPHSTLTSWSLCK